MSTWPLSLEMSTRLLSPSHYLKARDEHAATFSEDEHIATFSHSFSQGKRTCRDEHSATFSGEMSTRLLSPSHYLKARDEHMATFSVSRQEMSTRLLSLEMSSRLLHPSHSLKARDEHSATFSGDEHNAIISISFTQGKR